MPIFFAIFPPFHSFYYLTAAWVNKPLQNQVDRVPKECHHFYKTVQMMF